MHMNNLKDGLTQEEMDELLADLPLPDLKAGNSGPHEHLDEIAALTEGTLPDVADPGPIGPTGPVEEPSVEAPVMTCDPAENVGPSESDETLVDAATGVTTLPSHCMPSGYANFSDGIYKMPDDESAKPIFICTPIRVDAMFADQNGRGWGRLVSVQAADGRWHEVPVASADLQRRPGEVIANLVDHGLELAIDKKAKDRLIGILKSWRPSEQLRTVTHTGWSGNDYEVFILGNEVLGNSKVLPIVPMAGHANGLTCDGSVEDWKQHVGLNCRENPLMILAVSLAFSGPLLAPAGLMGGGLHFRGASSSGKTTLLNLAASVWGNRQLISQWRATSNGLEAVARSRNDMLLPLDEIAEIPARDLHNAIYMLANGAGKVRMTKNVTLADQPNWRLALISSGEISIEEKLKEANLGAMAGHEVRLIDIEADSRAYGAFDHLHGSRTAASFAEGIQGAVRASHGAVGRKFVHKLIEVHKAKGFQNFLTLADRHCASWLAKLPSAPDGQISRVARRFSLIALAGDLATGFKLTGWSIGDASKVAEQAFFDWYDRRYSCRREAVNGFVKTMQDFLAASTDKLTSVGSPKSGGESLGWLDGGHVYLPLSTWTHLYPGDDGPKAAKALLDMQLLLAGENGRHTRKAPRAIPDRPRLYTVNAERVSAYKRD